MGYFRVVLGEDQLGLEDNGSYGEIGSYSTTNIPCGEGGAGCNGTDIIH